MNNTLGQPAVALAMLGAGAAAGLIFSLLSLLRYCSEKPKIRGFVFDFCFSICAGATFLLMNFALNDGRFLFFPPFCFLAGIAGVYLLFRKTTVKRLPKMREKSRKRAEKFGKSRFGKIIFK